MPEFKLVMTFKNAMNKNTAMTIPDARPDLTQAEAVAAMDTLLGADVFRPDNIALVEKVDCKLVETTQSDFYNAP